MKIPSSQRSWITEVVPPDERFGMWRDALNAALTPRIVERHSSENFSGRLFAYEIGSMRATRGWCDPIVVSRTAREIAKSKCDYLYFLCPVRGSVSMRQSGRTLELKAGDCAFVKTGEPFQLIYNNVVDAVTVEIPLHEIVPGRESVQICTAVNLVQRGASGAALQSFLKSLLRNPLRANPQHATALASVAFKLVALTLRECAIPESKWARERNRRSDSVVQHIECNLSDPLLSPLRAAKSLGVSERTVHAAMKETGQSFMTYVKLRRIDHVADALAEAQQDGLRISDFAFEWGFNDLSTFHRAFRERYGVTPRQYKVSRFLEGLTRR